MGTGYNKSATITRVSILILLDYLFLYLVKDYYVEHSEIGLNPYFIGLPILIYLITWDGEMLTIRLNPYFIGLPILIPLCGRQGCNPQFVSILILLDYLFL